MVVVTLPLISGLYGLQRYFIICFAHLISKYCTVKTTIISVAIIIVVGSILSFHEVFDENMYYNGVSASLLVTNHQKHENFTGVVVIIVLLIIIVTVSVLHAIITKNVNDALAKSIKFLARQSDKRFEFRISAYSNLLRFNSLFLLTTLISMMIDFYQKLVPELHRLYLAPKQKNFAATSVMYTMYTMTLLSSFEISVFPLLIMSILPTSKKFLIMVAQKLTTIC